MLNWLLEKSLGLYRKRDRLSMLESLGDEFSKYESLTKKLLDETEFYHGTGAKHYFYDKGNKYESEKFKIIDTLQSILDKGLQPQHDLFNKIFKTSVDKTLSLTTNRQYAFVYAQFYFSEGFDLRYQYGPSFFWVKGVATRLVCGSLYKKLSYKGLKEWPREIKIYRQMLKRWSKSFRKDGKYEGKSFSLCGNACSDIPHNFGIVIGIKKGVLKPIQINYPNVGEDEVRVSMVITPDSFSHIQVPLDYISVVTQACTRANIRVPIIPIEFVELYNYKIGLS